MVLNPAFIRGTGSRSGSLGLVGHKRQVPNCKEMNKDASRAAASIDGALYE